MIYNSKINLQIADTSLGRVEGRTLRLAGTPGKLLAIPEWDCEFVHWRDVDTGQIVSVDPELYIESWSNMNLEPVFRHVALTPEYVDKHDIVEPIKYLTTYYGVGSPPGERRFDEPGYPFKNHTGYTGAHRESQRNNFIYNESVYKSRVSMSNKSKSHYGDQFVWTKAQRISDDTHWLGRVQYNHDTKSIEAAVGYHKPYAYIGIDTNKVEGYKAGMLRLRDYQFPIHTDYSHGTSPMFSTSRSDIAPGASNTYTYPQWGWSYLHYTGHNTGYYKNNPDASTGKSPAVYPIPQYVKTFGGFGTTQIGVGNTVEMIDYVDTQWDSKDYPELKQSRVNSYRHTPRNLTTLRDIDHLAYNSKIFLMYNNTNAYGAINLRPGTTFNSHDWYTTDTYQYEHLKPTSRFHTPFVYATHGIPLVLNHYNVDRKQYKDYRYNDWGTGPDAYGNNWKLNQNTTAGLFDGREPHDDPNWLTSAPNSNCAMDCLRYSKLVRMGNADPIYNGVYNYSLFTNYGRSLVRLTTWGNNGGPGRGHLNYNNSNYQIHDRYKPFRTSFKHLKGWKNLRYFWMSDDGDGYDEWGAMDAWTGLKDTKMEYVYIRGNTNTLKNLRWSDIPSTVKLADISPNPIPTPNDPLPQETVVTSFSFETELDDALYGTKLIKSSDTITLNTEQR